MGRSEAKCRWSRRSGIGDEGGTRGVNVLKLAVAGQSVEAQHVYAGVRVLPRCIASTCMRCTSAPQPYKKSTDSFPEICPSTVPSTFRAHIEETSRWLEDIFHIHLTLMLLPCR